MSDKPIALRGLRLRRVDHIAVNVRDLNRSAAFYARVFALIEGPRTTFRRILEASEFSLHLFQAPTRRPEAGSRDWRRLGMQHVALAVDDAEFERAAEVIVAAGSAVEGPVEDSEGRSLYLRDPDGNVLEIRNAWDSARAD